jgi:superfamily I DNA and/or RNA helicase
MVSDAFYANRSGGGLITKRADHDHDITHPNWLRGQALVWLDTGETQQAAGNWTNQIEANLVANLVRSLRFEPGRPGWGGTDRLAIITPYRAQNNLIRELLPEAENLIWTVDSFQGREADIVIVSLVRDREDQREDPYAALGHVAEPRRANVLLSRARDLLVIVGRLARYERCGVQEWERAANAAKAGGRVVDMRTVGAS